MSHSRNCVHGVMVNETCVCDFLWKGDSCQHRDCHSGDLEDGICHCPLRHVGEFCEYHACYHKDVLYCWGTRDVQLLPCNTSAIGAGVDRDAVKDPAWYCPCGGGRRTPPPHSHCVCDEAYAGEFCTYKTCEGASDCSDSPTFGNGETPFFHNNGNAKGVMVPDSAKVAMVCMSMVVLVAVILCLKRKCIRRPLNSLAREIAEAAPDLRVHCSHHHPLTPAQLSATLLMLQSRRGGALPCGWEGPSSNHGRRGNGQSTYRAAPLPSYEEANSAPPPYSSILAQTKASLVSVKSTGRKGSTVVDAEAGMARIQTSQQTSGETPAVAHVGPKTSVLQHQDTTEARPKKDADHRRRSL